MVKRHLLLNAVARSAIPGLLLLSSTAAHSAGFYLIEQSVSSMGTAYANGSAGMDDASTIFFNPATMTRLQGQHASGGIHVIYSQVDIDASARYNPEHPAISGTPLENAPVSGKRKTDTDLLAAVPHGGYSHQLNDRTWLGITVNGPFGLKTKYDDNDWVGRYHALRGELRTYNINPAIAFKFSDKASVGFGISAMYGDGDLTNEVDAGLLVPPQLGGGPGTFDGRAQLDGDDWAWGWNAGILLEPNDRTRFGLHYRSKVELELEGDAKFGTTLPAQVPSQNFKEDAELDITMPDLISLSAWHAVTDKLALMADVTWTEWSEVEDIRVVRENGVRLSKWEWEDTVRIAVGGSYQFDSKWQFRGGVAWDETPTPNDRLRTPYVPDEDRIWLTLGANYRFSKNLSLDVGYAHLFVDDPEIKNGEDAIDPSKGETEGLHLLNADYDASVDMFSLQVNWAFD
jgi:long-chain fatty acid transport protein